MNKPLLSFGIFAAGVSIVAVGAVGSRAFAAEPNYAGKTLTMVIGFGAGGGVDAYGRLVGEIMARHLPGKPNVIAVNQPGAGGMVAAKSWVAKGQTDGLAILVGAQSQADPQALMRTRATFKPADFKFIGGVAAPSQALFIRKDALDRLKDKSKNPVVIGVVGTTLRSGSYQVMWGAAYLGWNIKWVKGYSQTSELRGAIERSEIDMSTFGSTRDIDYLKKNAVVSLLSQSGTKVDGKAMPRDILGDTPVMADMLKGKITDPMALRAFDYAEAVGQVGKWLALPPGTPDDIVNTHVKAFQAMLKDPLYLSRITKVDPDSPLVSAKDIAEVMNDLGKVSPDVMAFIDKELERQGFGPAAGSKKKGKKKAQ